MLTFARPADAIEFGLAMDRFVDAEPQFPALHIGAHHGSVLYREGDYVGGTVNLAARVASSGAAGSSLLQKIFARRRGISQTPPSHCCRRDDSRNSRSDASCWGASL